MSKARLLLVFALVAAWVLPHVVQAQASGLRVVESHAQGDFPDTISFSLEAESSTTINQVVLQFRVKQANCAPSLATEKPDFTPGNAVSVTWTWPLKKVGGLPPGSLIEFRWQLADSAGGRLTTDWQLFEFTDQRYNWQTMTGKGLTLYWYRGSPDFASELVKAGEGALDRLARDTGAQLKATARLYIYGSSEEVRGAFIFSAEWTGGQAVPGTNIIALGIGPEILGWGRTAVAHELSHLVVGEVTFNCYAGIPTWLSEGLAVYAEGDVSSDRAARLRRAISQDQLLSVRSLSGSFPADSEQANLSYTQSRSLVEFLIQRNGAEKMLQLLNVFGEGSRYDAALSQVYGLDSDGLDAAWREWIGAGPRPTPSPASPGPASAATPTPIPSGRGGGCQPSLRASAGPSDGWVLGLALLVGLMVPPAGQLWLERRRQAGRSTLPASKEKRRAND